jgi:hypothetical protein
MQEAKTVSVLTAMATKTGRSSTQTTFPCSLRAREVHLQILDQQRQLDEDFHLLL